MPNVEAETLKAQGNEALARGDLPRALELYSSAIRLEENAVYYSNRCACLLRMRKYQDALLDANRCIFLRPSWFKGYAHAGTTLMALDRADEAVRKLEQGIAVEPDNRSLQDKLQEARASIRPVQPQSGSGLLLGTPAARLRTAHAALRAFVVANALLYVLPVLGSTAAARCYSSALMGTVVSMLWAAVAQHGAPRMDKQYAALLAQDLSVQHAMMSALLLLGRPFLLGIFAATAFEFVHFASFAHGLANVTQPSLARGMASAGNTMGHYMTGRAAGWQHQSDAEKWQLVNAKLASVVATAEVWIGMLLLVELVTPYRQLLLLFSFWNFLRVRYISSAHTRAAFRSLDALLMSAVGHRLCPTIIRGGYMRVRAFAASYVQLPGAAGQGGRPSCTIM